LTAVKYQLTEGINIIYRL